MYADFYQRVIQSVDTPMYVTDTEGTFVSINSAFERLTGYSTHELEGKKTSILKSYKMPKDYYVRLWKTILSGQTWKEEIINQRKDRSFYTVLQSISPIWDEEGRIVYFAAVQYDISREKELEDERHIFFNVSVDLFCIIDKDGIFKQLNEAWAKYMGYSVYDLKGTRITDLVHPEEKENLEVLFRAPSVDNGIIQIDTRMTTGEGIYRWVSWRVYYYKEKKVFYFSGRDIQERVEMEQEIRKLSITDKLTGIYNRLQCDEKLEHEVARSSRNDRPLALILFDIDHFKQVNDTYGHQRGDSVLIEITKIVQESIREYDFFARWGGEEFLIIAPETEKKEAQAQAERLRKNVEQTPFEEVDRVTVSLGLSMLKGADDDAESMLRRADEALYKAKKEGRNRLVLAE